MLRVDYVGMGNRIREQRHRIQLTQAKLGEQMHLSQQYIGLLERGARIPSLETVITFCYVLDVPLEYLLQDSLPESLFTHYSNVSSRNTLRSVMGTLRNTLTDLFVPPERPHFIPPDAPATDEQLARIPFGYLDPPRPRRPRKKKPPKEPVPAESAEQVAPAVQEPPAVQPAPSPVPKRKSRAKKADAQPVDAPAKAKPSRSRKKAAP